MNRFSNPCRRQRKSLCLLASGLLSGADRTDIENHLAECAGCQSYYNEIKSVAVPLTAWERHFAQIEPAATVQMCLAKTTAAGSKPESVRSFTPITFLSECWQQLFWPSRRIWTGLAAVWVLILAANVSMRDRSQPSMAKTSPTLEMIQAWRQQERVLAELIGSNETRTIVPPKPFSPRPSSERYMEMMTA